MPERGLRMGHCAPHFLFANHHTNIRCAGCDVPPPGYGCEHTGPAAVEDPHIGLSYCGTSVQEIVPLDVYPVKSVGRAAHYNHVQVLYGQ